ncbi:thioesterase family protein [Nocardia sp. NPDC006630]|uniref:acyl-CoA thioesterase n=1 Tax=Nocardia sp. NPDC006630 TaxID=3157181 RepID=UPI0033A338D0
MPRTVTPPHPFDVATELIYDGDGNYRGQTTPDYANMVGPFGGITAATLLRAAQEHPDCLGEPLSITVNYAGPIANGPFVISAVPVRTNRNTQHWTLTLSQDGAVTTTATAVFGNRRQTWSSTEVTAPAVPPADSLEPEALPEFIAWVRNYEMRFAEGAIAIQDADPNHSSTTTLWVRETPARPLDYPGLTALSDVFFPRVMLRLGRVVPAGTVSLTVYFHADTELLTAQSDLPVLATARSQHFGNGFFDQSAELWANNGTLLATSHQMVYFKD